MNYANDHENAQAAFADLRQVSRDSCLVHGDVTDAGGGRDECAARWLDELGPIDILVINATCSQPELPFEQYDWEFFQSMLDYFVKSPVLLMKACLPHMKKQQWGRIVHITSEVVALARTRPSALTSRPKAAKPDWPSAPRENWPAPASP